MDIPNRPLTSLSEVDLVGYFDKIRCSLEKSQSDLTRELTSLIKPISEKQEGIIADLNATKAKVDNIDNECKDTREQLSKLQQEVTSMKQQNNQQHYVPRQIPASMRSDSNLRVSEYSQPDRQSTSFSITSNPAISVLNEAKKVLGFSPIKALDIQYLQDKLSISDEAKARERAIRDFLIGEMNIPKNIAESLPIIKTFTPARRPNDWTTLYAEFRDTSIVDLINQYLVNLKPGKSVNIYVPHSLYPRFSSINRLAHEYRNGDLKHKTKVRYGVSDFVLLIKPETNSRWTYASLSHLPPLELSLFDGNIATSSPPGRSRLPFS